MVTETNVSFVIIMRKLLGSPTPPKDWGTGYQGTSLVIGGLGFSSTTQLPGRGDRMEFESVGEENGNPLQCCGLENPMDRGA